MLSRLLARPSVGSGVVGQRPSSVSPQSAVRWAYPGRSRTVTDGRRVDTDGRVDTGRAAGIGGRVDTGRAASIGGRVDTGRRGPRHGSPRRRGDGTDDDAGAKPPSTPARRRSLAVHPVDESGELRRARHLCDLWRPDSRRRGATGPLARPTGRPVRLPATLLSGDRRGRPDGRTAGETGLGRSRVSNVGVARRVGRLLGDAEVLGRVDDAEDRPHRVDERDNRRRRDRVGRKTASAGPHGGNGVGGTAWRESVPEHRSVSGGAAGGSGTEPAEG